VETNISEEYAVFILRVEVGKYAVRFAKKTVCQIHGRGKEMQPINTIPSSRLNLSLERTPMGGIRQEDERGIFDIVTLMTKLKLFPITPWRTIGL
jgi:hypothetical protein